MHFQTDKDGNFPIPTQTLVTNRGGLFSAAGESVRECDKCPLTSGHGARSVLTLLGNMGETELCRCCPFAKRQCLAYSNTEMPVTTTAVVLPRAEGQRRRLLTSSDLRRRATRTNLPAQAVQPGEGASDEPLEISHTRITADLLAVYDRLVHPFYSYYIKVRKPPGLGEKASVPDRNRPTRVPTHLPDVPLHSSRRFRARSIQR